MNEPSTDGQLLAEFLAGREPRAFEELVQRHAGLVYNVCRRVLSPADAEDAAQAVFLTLLHKAKSLRSRASIAGWLHHVAWHVAMRAREAASIRARHEQESASMNSAVATSSEWDDLRPLLDAELDALPEKYRLPLILHHLEGRTKEETATLLNSNVGTISARLARGREMLRGRLGRRGVALSSLVIASLITEKASAATVPPALVASTVKAAVLIAAGKVAAGTVVSSQSAALAQGALKMIYIAKLKFAAAASLILVGAATIGIFAQLALAQTANPAPNPAPATQKAVGGWGAPINIPGANPAPAAPAAPGQRAGGGMVGGNPWGGGAGGAGLGGGAFGGASTQPFTNGPMGIPGKLVKSDDPNTLILESRRGGSSLYTRAFLQVDNDTVFNLDGRKAALGDIPLGTILIADLIVNKDGSYKVTQVTDLGHYSRGR